MVRFIANRLFLAIPTLIGVAIITFFVLRVLPGDIVEAKLRGDGAQVTVDVIERERARLGLDKPLSAQFADWMIGLARLDLGKAMWTGRPVIEEIAARFELTFQIALMATIIGTVIAIPLGTLAALFRGSWIDTAIRLFAVAGLAVPEFLAGHADHHDAALHGRNTAADHLHLDLQGSSSQTSRNSSGLHLRSATASRQC